MNRSTFFLILVVIGLIFGAMFVFVPDMIATMSGVEPVPVMTVPVRGLGVMILAVTLLNFLVRNDPDSTTLRAVLWANLAVHVLTPVVDIYGAAQGLMPAGSILPGLVVHLLAAWGCFHFAGRVKV